MLGLLLAIVANPFILLTPKGISDTMFCNFEVNLAVVKRQKIQTESSLFIKSNNIRSQASKTNY